MSFLVIKRNPKLVTLNQRRVMDKWPPLLVELKLDEGMYAFRHKRAATSGEK